jgi:hypothetical protein
VVPFAVAVAVFSEPDGEAAEIVDVIGKNSRRMSRQVNGNVYEVRICVVACKRRKRRSRPAFSGC